VTVNPLTADADVTGATAVILPTQSPRWAMSTLTDLSCVLGHRVDGCLTQAQETRSNPMQTMPPTVEIASHEALQQTLVDLAALATYTKQAHWNISGPNFMSVHLYLDQLTDMLRDSADVVGERIAALGASPDGRAITVSQCTTLTTIPAGDLEIPDALSALDANLTELIEAIATRIAATTDIVNADLLTKVLDDLGQHRWFVRSQL
jgi:starvation-inducible DNA-binding protein